LDSSSLVNLSALALSVSFHCEVVAPRVLSGKGRLLALMSFDCGFLGGNQSLAEYFGG